MDDRIALLDLDGTVADYDGAMTAALARLAAPEEPRAIPYGDAEPAYMKERRRLIKSQPGFWRNLPVLERGFHVVRVLQELGFGIHVLTKGSRDATASWTEKFEWVRTYLPDASVTISQDKSLVYGRVLVDDWPDYFNPWLRVRPRGLVIAIAHPWNEMTTDSRVIRYDGTNLDQVTDALRKVYERQPGHAIF